MELLFQMHATPIEFLCRAPDLARAMTPQTLTNNLLLIHLAVVALDVIAVALIVWLTRSLTRWWRRSAGAIDGLIGRHNRAPLLPARVVVACRTSRNHPDNVLPRAHPSRPTPPHGLVR